MAKSILSSSDPSLAGDNRTIIAYVLVRTAVDGTHNTTVFRLLPIADFYLLRCFMALALFPSNTATIRGTGFPFLDAVTRIATLPQPRVVEPGSRPDPALWRDMHRMPFVVLLVADHLPRWAFELARKRPTIVASQHDEVLRTAEGLGSFPARLAGTGDLREFYGALQELATALLALEDPGSDFHDHLSSVAAGNLFEERSRLRFLPGLPLPPTDAGRSGCYLYNRLSNNVDEPTIAAAVPEESTKFFRMAFNWTFSACRLLALVETGVEPPGDLGVTVAELGEAYGRLLGDAIDSDKFNLLMHLGERASRARPVPSFVTVPVPRRDIIRGKVPTGIDVKDQSRWSSVLLRALRDLSEGHGKARFSSAYAQRVYDRARETLLVEDRLLSCASATLAARLGAEPLQLGPRDALVYSAVENLHGAIEANSRKVSTLFRRVEVELRGLIQADALSRIGAGTAPVTFFSDLPFEWTASGDWPLCLTKPVARIPIGVTRWDVLTAALEAPVAIDSRDAARVLMLDLIDRNDPIRESTESFIASSTRLGQHYTYATPRNGAEAARVLGTGGIDIVVLDAHCSYERSTDTLRVGLPEGMFTVGELMPHGRVPPLWILSACDTSVTGALRGCFVRRLLAMGAVCVVATLAPVDAFTASMFVGKLLTGIYSPVERREDRDFHTEFFDTQITTAILYDPLLPLIRKAVRRPELRQKLGFVIGEFYAWARTAQLGAREFRVGGAQKLSSSLEGCGLAGLHHAHQASGAIRPETLLFTAFGAPGRIELR